MVQTTHLLFDCDNTLALTEHLAFEACADLANEILEKYTGTAGTYTGGQLITDFVGQNFRGMLGSLQEKHKFTVPQDELEKYVRLEEDRVIAKIQQACEPCPGVIPVLESLYSSKKYSLAVVSSSAKRRVIASLVKVDEDKYFQPVEELVFSAATSLEKPTSKPDPAIYLFALKKLGNVKPQEAVAIEDSKSGATAAIRAGIPTIGYVGPYETEEKKQEMRELFKNLGAKVIMEHWDEFDGLLEKIQAKL